MPSGNLEGMFYLGELLLASQAMRKNILMRLVGAIVGIILCVWGIWSAGAAGLSKLNSKYALVSRSLAPAERAVHLTDSDPEAHSSLALVLRNERDLKGAVREFERAATLRPRDYVLWYELALARDSAGDEEGALAACQQSISLAPYYGRPHWLLGNLLFRAGRREEAFAELRRAATSDSKFISSLIDLAWGAHRGDAVAVEQAVQPQTNVARIALAKYFVRKGKIDEALTLFRAAGEVSEDERRALLKELLTAGRFKEAYDIWAMSREESVVKHGNGYRGITEPGFEGAIRLNEAGFNWQQPAGLDNVQVSLDTANAHAGARSLRIELSGDSNPTVPIISQLVTVEPNARYTLNFAARTEQIVTGGLPQITVSEAAVSEANKAPLGAMPLPASTDSWRDFSVQFVTGKETEAIVIKIDRQSCGGNPCPAYGRIWLDDFSLQKQSAGAN
jgi:tetratricopeptide (TPR) repeat protein